MIILISVKEGVMGGDKIWVIFCVIQSSISRNK
jgi:hypothetical protein